MQKYLIIIALFFITLSNEVKAEEKISIVNMELLLEKSIAGKSIKFNENYNVYIVPCTTGVSVHF